MIMSVIKTPNICIIFQFFKQNFFMKKPSDRYELHFDKPCNNKIVR